VFAGHPQAKAAINLKAPCLILFFTLTLFISDSADVDTWGERHEEALI
jgi:hypothetical protein